MIRDILRISVEYLKPYKFFIGLNFLIIFSASLFEIFGIGMLIPILQSMINSDEEEIFFIKYVKIIFNKLNIEYTFVNLIIIFAIVMLVKYFLMGLQQYLSRVLSATVIRDLREKAFSNLMSVPLSFFFRRKIGDLVATTYTSANNAGAIVEYFMFFTNGLIFAFAYIVANCMISFTLTGITIALSSISYFFIFPRFKNMYEQGAIEKSLMDGINSFLQDSLSGIKIIKAFNNEAKHRKEYGGLINHYKMTQIKIMLNKILAFFMLEPFAFMMVIAVLIISYKGLGISLIHMIVFLFVFTQLLPKVKIINANYMHINELMPHFQKIHEIIRKIDKAYLVPGTIKINSFDGEVAFSNVNFCYPGKKEHALAKINFKIVKNTTVAIVGGSGGGKTTLVDLILRHHDPDTGSVTVDGINLREIDTKDWHRLISIVDQDPYLFNDTIYKNIVYGGINASKNDVYRASKIANAHEFIMQLPDKYQTNVGNRGIKLSGGQRQRISLARALIRDPDILILDEATSALDSQSERLIQESINRFKKNKTLIVIAHRLSTIINSDKIIIVENGVVVEEGTHHQLVSENGRYKHYFDLQFSNDYK